MFDDFDYESPQYELRRRFAADFYRRQQPKYETALGHAASVDFTRQWREWREYREAINQQARTQREFDKSAFAFCDEWLRKWTPEKIEQVTSGEPEVPPTPEDEVARLSAAWGVDAERISEVIRKGTKKSIPYRLRKRSWTYDNLLKKRAYQGTQKDDDAVQDAWVALLTNSNGTIDGRDAHIAGINAGRDNGRQDAKLIPISQMNSDDPDAPEATLDSVRVFDTELDYQNTDEYQMDLAQDAVRRVIINQFKQESPDDYCFIVDYLSRVEREPRFRGGRIVLVSKRGSKTTPAERKRAHDILLRLKQWESSEKW
jgi:hypothetical protein